MVDRFKLLKYFFFNYISETLTYTVIDNLYQRLQHNSINCFVIQKLNKTKFLTWTPAWAKLCFVLSTISW